MDRGFRFFVGLVAFATAIYFVFKLVGWLTDESELFIDDQLRWQFIALVLLLLVWLAAFGFLQLAKQTEKRIWYFLEHPLYSFSAKILLVLILAVGAALLLVGFNEGEAGSVISPLAILFTGVLATVGWNYTSFETRRSEIRKFTVDTINKIIDDASFQRLQSEFWIGVTEKKSAKFSEYQRLQCRAGYRDCVAFFSKGDRPSSNEPGGDTIEGIRHIYAFGRFLDQLEWLALLIRLRRIDEQLAREMLYDTVTSATIEMQAFIREARNSDPATYEHLVWLVEHWTGERSALHPDPLHLRA